jgi:integrase
VDEAQYRALHRQLRADLRTVVAIAYHFGWRARSEILTLERRHVDLDASPHGTLRLDPGMAKNRDGRVVYLTPEVRQLVAAQLERVDALAKKLAKDSPVPRLIPYVFPHLTGAHRGQRIEEFRKAWRKATRAAGLPGLLVHDLRRSAVRNMEQRGVPRSVAMKLTGHRTESVYRRYAIVSDADLREASRRLADGRPALVR